MVLELIMMIDDKMLQMKSPTPVASWAGGHDHNEKTSQITDVTSYGGNEEKVAKSLGSSECDGGGAKTIEGVEAEENQAENNV